MYKFLTKHGQLIAILVGLAIVAIYFISVFTGLDGAGYSTSDDLNQILKNAKKVEGGAVPTFDFFNPGLMATIALGILGFAAALFFGFWQTISTPKQSLKALVGVIAIAVLFFAFYSSADPSAVNKDLADKFDITDNISKYISGGMATSLVLLAGAFGIMVLGELRNLFK